MKSGWGVVASPVRRGGVGIRAGFESQNCALPLQQMQFYLHAVKFLLLLHALVAFNDGNPGDQGKREAQADDWLFMFGMVMNVAGA